MKLIPDAKRASWRFHVVRAGESLDTVASSFHDRVADIAEANGLTESALVRPGDELVIPETVVAAAPHTTHYVTRTGDTLVTIADRFNVSVEELRRWNHLSSSRIGPHRTLAVAQPVRVSSAASTRVRRDMEQALRRRVRVGRRRRRGVLHRLRGSLPRSAAHKKAASSKSHARSK